MRKIEEMKMNAKEIRAEVERQFSGAETLKAGKKKDAISFLLKHFDCSYSVAYYLVTQARNTPECFDRLAFKDWKE